MAVRLFKESKQIEKANLIAALEQPTVSIYRCGDFYDYLYGAMLPETRGLDRFALDFEAPGILLRTPDMGTDGAVRERIPQPKLSHILSESKRWAQILHCNYVTDLNRANRNGQIGDIIRVSEALQEKRIAQIADHIAAERKMLRLILIAGPSSSGKTSFAQRLRIQLRVNGLEPVSISLDDFSVHGWKRHAMKRANMIMSVLALWIPICLIRTWSTYWQGGRSFYRGIILLPENGNGRRMHRLR